MQPNVPSAQARNLTALTGKVTKANTPDPASPREAIHEASPMGSQSSNTSNSDNTGIRGKSGTTGITGSAGITGNSTESADGTQMARAERSKLSVYVPTQIADRARSAWRMTGLTPGKEYLSFSAWVAQAIEKAVLEAEQELNGGQPFPPTPVGISPRGRLSH